MDVVGEAMNQVQRVATVGASRERRCQSARGHAVARAACEVGGGGHR